MRSDREYGFIRPPTASQLQEYATRHRMTLTDEETAQLVPVLAGSIQVYDLIDELPEPPAPASAFTQRSVGRAPLPAEDPYNAFIRLCEVKGAETGPLAGLTMAVKDCIAVAGIPTTNGSRMLPTAVPTEDAVVVERLLAAGASVVGKTNMEDMALGIGEASAYGPAKNPVDPRFNTGGSSSGSGAAVAAGMVDFALGADEAGSVRIPAAWCGLVGMKATHGLVPSYGLSYMDHTIDHIGPITKDVALNAAVLEVMAGSDWRDPQWVRADPVAGSYTQGLDAGVAGFRLGLIAESLQPIGSTPDVLEAFERACDELRAQGAIIETISVPLWTHAWSIETALLAFSARAMVDSGGAGYFHKGRIAPGQIETTSSQFRNTADDYAIFGKLNLLTAEHLRDQYLGSHYAKAQNLRIELTRQVSEALGSLDALLTPTIPTVAGELELERHDLLGMLPRIAGSSIFNTCALDLTGHPALTVPAGPGSHGLPVGLQAIGGLFAEATLYRIGAAVESVGLWTPPTTATAARLALA